MSAAQRCARAAEIEVRGASGFARRQKSDNVVVIVFNRFPSALACAFEGWPRSQVAAEHTGLESRIAASPLLYRYARRSHKSASRFRSRLFIFWNSEPQE